MSAQETDILRFTDDNLQCLIDCIQDELTDAVNNALDVDTMYPIGYIYRTSKAPADGGDPNDLFPGTTWVRLTDAYIRAAGSGDTVDSNPAQDAPHGSNVRTASQLPKHEHAIVTSYRTYSGVTPTDHTDTYYPDWFRSEIQLLWKYNTLSKYGSLDYTDNNSFWYGTDKDTKHTKWCKVAINFYTSTYNHTHTIPVNQNTDGSANMDIQPKHLYKYYWERTA